MTAIAALVLPGTFSASLAAFTDAFDLLQERKERTIGPDDARIPDLRLTLLSPDGRDMPIGQRGMLRVDGVPSPGEHFELIWIPSFRAYGEDDLRQRLAASGPVVEWLTRAARAGAVIGASGAAVVLPLAARLAERLDVPVAAPLLPVVRALFPRFRHASDVGFADHGSLVLSRGIGQDVAAVTALFARCFSPESGRWLRSVFGNDAAADDNDPTGEEARDPLATKARLLLEQRFASAPSIAALADELFVSHAVLIRHFRRAFGVTPARYVQQLRLNAAQRMLLRSSRSIDSIAAAVGYGDARLFREMFRKCTGTSASAWRLAQRSAPAASEQLRPAEPSHLR